MMAKYKITRSRDKINRSGVEFYGPVDENGGHLTGESRLPLTFNQSDGNVAIAELEVNVWYRVEVKFFGEKGAELTGNAQRVASTDPAKVIFALKIPETIGGHPTALGYPYHSTAIFKLEA
jgi:hypothetical protein